jgi:DNA helicase-2/ATP-dependent DNA helicase PcrA
MYAWSSVASDESKLRLALGKMRDSVTGAEGWDDEERLRILADIEMMMECWKVYAQGTASSRLTLSGFRAKLSLGLVGPTEESDVLTLATVHSVKGMEFDIVFLAGMVEGVFPDYRARPGTRAMREEKNDAFVAMTRARRLLYITYPEARIMPWGDVRRQQVSRFVTLTGIYPLRSDPHHEALVAER